MKLILPTIFCVSAATMLALSARAEENPASKAESTTNAGEAVHRTDRTYGAIKASELIGMTVKNYQNEKLGKVEEIAVDVESGRIAQVILSHRVIEDIGEIRSTVPPGALHYDEVQKVVHLDATKDTLMGAPSFKRTQWKEYSTSNHLADTYRHYDEESAYTFIEGSDVREARREPNTTAGRAPDGNWEKDRPDSATRTRIPVSRLSHLQRASKIIGSPVKNGQEEKLGKVDDLVVDLAAGRIVAVVISYGGFLGMGGSLSAVPAQSFHYSTEPKALTLDATKETLASGPHFKANQWPDFNQPAYADSVYRAYGVQPYFSTNTIYQAENTVHNVRDRNDKTLTPIDQGSSAADIQTTAQIRKEIGATSNISVTAQNVKVISNQGKVTLRGPVETLEEKRIIEDIAHRVASSATVDSQLEVKLLPTGRSQDGRKP